jgi:mono/diheme cytochrome c family protein
MRLRMYISVLLAAASVGLFGCRNPPGKPQYTNETKRPDQVLDFETLYAKNCAGCHGDRGRNGAAISLANPIYLHVAGVSNIERVTANGIPGTMMPPFARSAGGLLTDEQIKIITQGMITDWGNATIPENPLTYAATTTGDASRGQTAFSNRCAGCHGADGTGSAMGNQHTGSLVNPAYLALVSDQGLRSILIAGEPEQGMPDWSTYPSGHLTDAEITDIVAWMGSKRIATPGQPYRQNPR